MRANGSPSAPRQPATASRLATLKRPIRWLRIARAPHGVRNWNASPSAEVTIALAAISASLSSAMLKRSACTPAGNCAANSRPNASSMLITALRRPGQANSFAFAAP